MNRLTEKHTSFVSLITSAFLAVAKETRETLPAPGKKAEEGLEKALEVLKKTDFAKLNDAIFVAESAKWMEFFQGF